MPCSAARQVVTLDRFMAERLERKASLGGRLSVIPPWPHETHLAPVAHEDNPFRRREGLEGKRVLMYSGNMSPAHPLDTILAASLRLRNHPQAMFLFIGGGLGRRKVEEFIERHRPPNVRLLPYEPLEQLRFSLSAADVHLVSMGDAMVGIVHPCKMYGAMACARPALLFGPRGCHLGELIEKHRIGWIVAHGDVDGAVALIERILGMDQAELTAMGRRASGRGDHLEQSRDVRAAVRSDREHVPAMSKLRALLIFGTRPEAIKMAPVVRQCARRCDAVESIVCLTGQQREMLRQVTDYFGIRADLQLDVMTPDQTLAGLTARCVEGIDDVLLRLRPQCVVAQGDTTTVMAAALAAFYRRIPMVHVEAGLRTGNLLAPWPEELNRRIADLVTALHCADAARRRGPAAGGCARVLRARDRQHGHRRPARDRRRERAEPGRWAAKYAFLGQRRMILITGHRRENFGPGLENVCRAIALLAEQLPDCHFVYPVHLNPNVQVPVRRALGDRPNIHLLDPAFYAEFVWLMDRSTLILTDSGGVQEEAPSLGKPILVMRQTTERPEAVEAGAAQLVGTSVEAIVAAANRLLSDPAAYRACQIDRNPYGDGHAAERIVELMLRQGWEE